MTRQKKDNCGGNAVKKTDSTGTFDGATYPAPEADSGAFCRELTLKMHQKLVSRSLRRNLIKAFAVSVQHQLDPEIAKGL